MHWNFTENFTGQLLPVNRISSVILSKLESLSWLSLLGLHSHSTWSSWTDSHLEVEKLSENTFFSPSIKIPNETYTQTLLSLIAISFFKSPLGKSMFSVSNTELMISDSLSVWTGHEIELEHMLRIKIAKSYHGGHTRATHYYAEGNKSVPFNWDKFWKRIWPYLRTWVLKQNFLVSVF